MILDTQGRPITSKRIEPQDGDREVIECLKEAGHTEECSKKMIWGDGVCNCGAIAKLQRLRGTC